ncbi:MAG: class SAM-dependent methyltransferase [bacterium]|nr:class SAM-dependent methyltransferase [bacterium]
MSFGLHRDYTFYHLGRLSSCLGASAGDLAVYAHELIDAPRPLRDLEAAVKDVAFFRRKSWESILDLGLYRIALYVLTRALKPAAFVETGVLHGITSNYILHALRLNGSGRLVSIDYPSYFESGPTNADGYNDTLPPAKEPGWVIPLDNREHWQLVIGPSADALPKVLAELPRLDLFVHDSEHTYATMWNEFGLAWEKLAAGGVLISDNIDANDAFSGFCRKVQRTPMVFPEANSAATARGPARFGVILK